jgi:hypothetical protein
MFWDEFTVFANQFLIHSPLQIEIFEYYFISHDLNLIWLFKISTTLNHYFITNIKSALENYFQVSISLDIASRPMPIKTWSYLLYHIHNNSISPYLWIWSRKSEQSGSSNRPQKTAYWALKNLTVWKTKILT